jgi:hypothetical protein
MPEGTKRSREHDQRTARDTPKTMYDTDGDKNFSLELKQAVKILKRPNVYRHIDSSMVAKHVNMLIDMLRNRKINSKYTRNSSMEVVFCWLIWTNVSFWISHHFFYVMATPKQ